DQALAVAWTRMDLPGTCETVSATIPATPGICPAGQGFVDLTQFGHRLLSIVASPTLSDIVYLGGMAQQGGAPGAPDSIGATDGTGMLFRCDSNGDAHANHGTMCRPLTLVSTAHGTAPHADSRDLIFDHHTTGGSPDPRLFEADDAGLYMRSDPGGWQ